MVSSSPVPLLSQDEELLGHVQSAILQVQGDCEKLNVTTSNLIEDHRQKQKDIDVSGPRGAGVGPHTAPAAQLRALHSSLAWPPGAVPGPGKT